MDMKNYAFAMRQYQGFKNEHMHLEYELEHNKNFGVEAGRQVAMLVSGAIAALVVVVYLIFTISAGGCESFLMAKRKQTSPVKSKVLLTGMLLTSVAILPTTLIFFIGMLPTIVARFTDKSRQRTRVLTIGFMNFAGCFPFWFKLMQGGHKFDLAVNLIADPFHVVVMYGAAVVGYLIEWALVGVVAGFMAQKGRKRLEDIRKAQDEMVERWGREVVGDVPLDPFGFPFEKKED